MKKPFVFINAAMSADGKISTCERRQVRISGAKDLERVDSLRASSDAVLVGIGTVLADDPSLTVKAERRRAERKKAGKDENPLRVVADSRARTPLNAEILNKGAGRRLVAVSKRAPAERVKALQKKADVVVCGAEKVDLAVLLRTLRQRYGVRRLMVEGGATLNWSLLSQGLVDELYVFVGNMIIGGVNAPTLVDGEGFKDNFLKLELLGVEPLDEGVLLKWRVLAAGARQHDEKRKYGCDGQVRVRK
ncbi:2,5-diamino-6-(ribosylamino)-4(3H)-pyrimidinone 5'-phosphate reductase [Candidatus Alkanophaga liquidiphilum]|nr:Pyrimidine reductase [Candidatus Alkanophaga liquidiphilum]